nr:unnamed protein product [Callosobruchus chinensis]
MLGYTYVYLNWDIITVSAVCSVLDVYLQCASNLMVVCIIFLNMDTLQSIIQHLQSEVFRPKCKQHIDIAKDLKKSGDFVRNYFVSAALVIVFVVPLIRLMGKNRQLLYLAYIPPWMNFTSLFVFQHICSIYSLIFCVSYGTLDANLMIEIGIQIEILKHTLENNEDISLIFGYIKHFEEILRMSEKVQHIFKVGLSAMFFTGILVLCTTLFRLMEISADELVFMLPFTIGITLALFGHCWFGSELIYRSEGIIESIFCSNWIGSNIPTQRVLLLFMTFAKRPLEMKLGGGLFTMSIPLFVSLLGYTYVYLNWDIITVSAVCSVLDVYLQCAINLTVVCIIFLNMDTLQSIIQHLQSEKSGDFVRNYCVLSVFVITILFPLTKLMGKDRQLLFLAYIPPWMNFTSIFVFQHVCSIYSLIFCTSYGTLDANLMIEIAIQLEILKDTLENSEDISLIFGYIKHFEEIHRMSEKVQHIFKVGLSVMFFTAISVLCTTLFRLMEITADELVFMLPFSIGITLVLFEHCWFGNELIYRSEGIIESIFCSNWIGSNIPTQRVLLLFMTFAKRPLEMKLGGGLFTMSIPLFVSLFGYLYVYMKWDTITVSDISSVLFVYIQCFNNMTVISCIFFNMDTLQSIIQQLESEKHVDIAKELKKSGDFIRKYCIATSLSIIFLYPLTKLLGKNRQLLHTAYTPSWMSFTTLFVFQEFVTIYSVFICSNYLTLDANLMIEIGIQIEIMKDILESNTDINLIFEYIKYFDEILRLSGKVQHIFSIGISVHFVTGILVVCTTLFRLMEQFGDAESLAHVHDLHKETSEDKARRRSFHDVYTLICFDMSNSILIPHPAPKV